MTQRLNVTGARNLIASIAAVCAFFCSAARGADLSGSWTTSGRMPDGTTHEGTLQLQESGGKLTGKVVSKRGSVDIAEGTVSGNQVSFLVVRVGNADELRIRFTGTVQADTIQLQMEYRDHPPVRMVAKRTQTGESKP